MIPPPSSLRVLVADGTALGAALVAAFLREGGRDCVAREIDPARAADEAVLLQADILLLGFRGATSLNTVAEIVARAPGTQVLVLSEVMSDSLAREAVRRGAAGFLFHGGDVESLLERIRACMGRAPTPALARAMPAS